MNPRQTPDRCRIVLIAPADADHQRVLTALDGGDVASLILPQWGADDDAFQAYAEKITGPAQERGVAVMIAADARIATRVRADGIHFEGSKGELEDLIARHQQKLMVGAGRATNRDDALELGETRPDYLFFGRFGYDTKPDAHPRNLKLGEWWSQMVQIPCVVMAGSEEPSVLAVAATGADFVALSQAVFGGDGDPAGMVSRLNALLDAEAPRFEG